MQQFATAQQNLTVTMIHSEQLTQMVKNLFECMLNMPVQEAANSAASTIVEPLTASVRVSGDWNADLHVVASSRFALLTACAMYATDPERIDDNEVLDALGEVANIIGGNAKGIVKKSCSLSIPCINHGEAPVSTYINEPLRLKLEHDGEPVEIILSET